MLPIFPVASTSGRFSPDMTKWVAGGVAEVMNPQLPELRIASPQ